MSFLRWVDDKRADVDAAHPLSLRTTIAGLTARLHTAENALTQLRRIHRPDPTGSWCCHDAYTWPCADAQILSDVACPSTDPFTGAACQKIRGHHGTHGGMGRDGGWHTWA